MKIDNTLKTNGQKYTAEEKAARRALPDVNGYTTHRIVTIGDDASYEMPVSYCVVKTAFGGWWGIAKFADGTEKKKFRGEPCRLVMCNGAKF